MVEIKRTLIIEHEDETFRFPEDVKNRVETLIKATCDGPRCTGPKGEGPTAVEWQESNDIRDVPDIAFGFITFAPFVGEKKIFCRPTCLRDFMRDYVPPKTPKEIAQEEVHHVEVSYKP